jgi:outer membrane receptor protein involved in Fe transport
MLLPLAGVFGGAVAQDDALEEVMVTATRRETSIQDIPYNISAITAEDIDRAGVTGLNDLVRVVPGLAYSDFGVRSAGLNNQLILRGLNANAQGSIGAFIVNQTPAGVSTYLDDVPLFVNLRLADLDRVEVLRGPQGTLYGAGSVGGTLRLIYNRPDPREFSARLDSRVSDTEDTGDLNYSVDGMVNLPLWTASALRVSAGYESLAGFVDATSLAIPGPTGPQILDPSAPFASPVAVHASKDTDDARQWYVRAAWLWDVTDWLQAQFTYNHQDDSADGFSFQTAASVVPGARDRTHTQYFNDPLDRNVDLYSLSVSMDFDFMRVESSTSYSDNESTSAGDLTGLLRVIDLFAGGFAFGGFPATNGRLLGFYANVDREETFAQEVRLISADNEHWNWVAGFYYQDTRRTLVEDISSPGFAAYANIPGHPIATAITGIPLSWAQFVSGPPGFVPPDQIADEIYNTLDQRVDIEDIALFGELTWRITDAWQITAGARVFWNDYGVRLNSTFPLFGAAVAQDGMDVTGLNVARSNQDVQDEIFKVNTSYDFSGDMMGYFTWAEGFRRGGANAFTSSGFAAEDPALLVFEPDTVTNYEIGLKGTSFDRLSYSMALYYMDWDKPQIAGTAKPTGFPLVVNADTARSRGIEIEGRFDVSPEIQVTAGYAFTDAELTDDYATPLSPIDTVPDFAGQEGNRLPGVPKHMASWSFDYTRPVNFLGESSINLHVDGFYRSSVVTDTSPASPTYVKLDGFDAWNASLTWTNDNWRAGLFVKNITDENGVTAVLRDFVFGRPEDAHDWVMRPRTVGLLIGYTY